MASSDDSQVVPVEMPALQVEDNPYKLRCVNRHCKDGHELIRAVEFVCVYYHVEYRRNKEVCTECFRNCLKHYKGLTNQLETRDCVLHCPFPSYDSFFVIESSSGEDEEETEKTEKTEKIVKTVAIIEQQQPSAPNVNLPSDPDVLALCEEGFKLYFDDKKNTLDVQIALCDTHTQSMVQACITGAQTVNTIAQNVEREIIALRNALYEPYRPTSEVMEIVDVEELSNNNVRVSIRRNRSAADIFAERDITDKDIITLNDVTVCTIPADLPQDGPLEYPTFKVGQHMYGRKFSLLDPWYKCKIQAIINTDYLHIKFNTDEKLLTTKDVAYFTQSSARFPVGSRVIANYSETDNRILNNYYAGIIAEPPKILNKFRYMVFFDDGNVRYRDHKDIRLILHKSPNVENDVQENCQEFIRSYLEKYPERQMVRLNKDHFVRAEYEQRWLVAKVLEVDASMVKLYFMDIQKSEWLYRGSSRLWNIFEKQSKSERGIRLRQSGLAYLKKPFVEYSNVETSEKVQKSKNVEPVGKEPSRAVVSRKSVARKSTTKNVSERNREIVTPKYKNITFKIFPLTLPPDVPVPKHLIPHTCDNSCIAWTEYSYEKTNKMSMLATPLYFAYIRYVVYFKSNNANVILSRYVMYRTPCGRMVRNQAEMLEYLIKTESEMTIDQFDFSSWVEPLVEYKVLKYELFIDDLSEGKEFRSITCVNTINSNLPPPMEYMTTRQPMPGVNINVESEFLCGCDCTDNCQDKTKCACWQMTIQGQKIIPNLYNDPNIGYSYRRLPERVLTGIYECNKTCKCNKSCLNRVVQQPLSQKLQLFLTEKKGWGVRCLNDIPQGSFICIYVGFLLTESDANEGGKNYGDEYLAELDYIEVVEKIKEDYESEVRPGNICIEDITSKNNKTSGASSDSSADESQERVVSEISLRLRKRKKKPKPEIKKKYRHTHKTSKVNARDMKNNPVPAKPMREYFGTKESVYIMDAKTSGNIGRYLNHSCSPNTFVQNVFVDTHDIRFPWVSFFSLHYIKAGTELTWDYSYDVGSVPGKVMNCHCESVHCRGRLL